MKIDAKKRLEAILGIASGLLFFYWRTDNKWFFYGAAIILLLGLFIRPASQAIAWLWWKLAEGLGWINSRILLSVVFFLFLTPIALLRRLVGKSGIQRKQYKTESYFDVREHTFTAKDLQNGW